MLEPIDKKKQKNHMQESYEVLQGVEGISDSTSAAVELAAIKAAHHAAAVYRITSFLYILVCILVRSLPGATISW